MCVLQVSRSACHLLPHGSLYSNRITCIGKVIVEYAGSPGIFGDADLHKLPKCVHKRNLFFQFFISNRYGHKTEGSQSSLVLLPT